MKKRANKTMSRGREAVTVWQAIRPRTAVEWVAFILIALTSMALAFGLGLWAGGFIWGL